MQLEKDRDISRIRFSQYLRTDELDTSKPHSVILSICGNNFDFQRGKVSYVIVPSNASLFDLVDFVYQVTLPQRGNSHSAEVTITRFSCAKKFTKVFEKYGKKALLQPQQMSWYSNVDYTAAPTLLRGIRALHTARDYNNNEDINSARAQEMLNEIYVLPQAVVVFNVRKQSSRVVRVADDADALASKYKKKSLGGVDAVIKEAQERLEVSDFHKIFALKVQIDNFDCSIADILPSMQECNEPAEAPWDGGLHAGRFAFQSRPEGQVELKISFTPHIPPLLGASAPCSFVRKVGVWRRLPDAQYPLQLNRNDISMYAHVW